MKGRQKEIETERESESETEGGENNKREKVTGCYLSSYLIRPYQRGPPGQPQRPLDTLLGMRWNMQTTVSGPCGQCLLGIDADVV